jgi:putative transcriptional regulator
MTISHHPQDYTLLRQAAGRLAPGPALIVSIHVAGCLACRARVGAFEAVGGALLEDSAPQPMAAGASEEALRRIDDAVEAKAALPVPDVPRLDDGLLIPVPLRGCAMGRWRWVGPGIRIRTVGVPNEPDAKVIMLKVKAGRRLPEHGHSGTEYTQVLHGSFSDERGRYGVGDFDEADAEIEHQPIVDGGSDCICIAALDGDMRLTGIIGRLVQPFVRL